MNKERELDFNKLENKKDDKSLYFYTTQNNLGNFLTHDSIFCKQGLKESDESFGNSIDNVLLFAKEPLSSESIKEFSPQIDGEKNIHPVVLEIDISTLLDLETFIIGDDYTLDKNKIRDAVEKPYLFLSILGYIPFSLVNKIHFRSEDNKDNLLSIIDRMDNIASFSDNTAMFGVTPSLFSGSCKPDKSKLRNHASTLSCGVNLSDIEKILKGYHCIRGSLFASFASFEFEFADFFRSRFDGTALSIIAKGIGELDFDREFNSIKKEVDCYIEKQNLLPIQNQDFLPSTYNVFSCWPWCLQFLNKISDEDINFVEENRDRSQDNQERLLDEIAYKSALFILFKGNESRPLAFLKKFEEEFNKNALNCCIDKDAISQYKESINIIYKIVNGTQEKTQFGKNRYTLEAIMYLCLAYDVDKFKALYNKSSDLSSDLKRLIWSFFGMLHGISPLGREFKDNKICSYLSNIIVHRNLSFSEIPNRLLSLQSLNKQIVEHESSKNTQEQIIFSKENIPFSIRISDKEEPIRKKLLTLVNNGQKEQVQELLFEFSKIPNEYIRWKTVYNGDIDTKYRGSQHTIYSKEEPVKNKIFDEESWDSFCKKFLEDKNSFKQLSLGKESIPKLNARLNQLLQEERKPNALKKMIIKGSPKKVH